MISLKNEQKSNLLDLYSDEICARIAQNLTLDGLGPLKEFLHKEQLAELVLNGNGDNDDVAMEVGEGTEEGEKTQEDEEEMARAKRMSIATEIWQKLNQSALHPQLYTAILEFLFPIDGELHASMCLERYVTEFVVGFSKMLNHSHLLISIIAGEFTVDEQDGELAPRWDQFSENLRKNVQGFEALVGPLRKRVEDGKIDRRRAMKLLLRSIPVSNINGYEHILCALHNIDYPAAKQLVERIYPNFIHEYEYIKYSALSHHNYIYVIRPEDDLSAVVEMGMKNAVPPPGANVLNIRLGNIPRIHIRAVNVDTVKEYPINLRPYQKELTTEALEGQNVIICAPTGSGKTIVGAYIIREHFLNAIRSGQRAKACFIVPTNSLVDQQKRLFNKFIGHLAKVRGLSGSGEGFSLKNPLRSVIDFADVIVITPQLLINELERRPLQIEESAFKQFSLAEFSLIIFDESHHSKDDHPYNILMAHYHRMKQAGAYTGNLPQIIGMTASLGIGGSASRNLDDAIQYTLEICANVDAKWISCVRQQRADLLSHMPSVVEDIDFVEPAGDCQFLGALLEQINLLKALMSQIPEAKEKEVSLQLDEQGGKNPMVQGFENWLCNLKQKFLKTTNLLSDQSRSHLMFCVDQLLIHHYTINFLNLFGQKTALRYQQKEEDEQANLKGAAAFVGQIRHWMGRLEAIVSNGYQHNSPLLDRLISILNTQFIANKDSRVLVFLKQRDQCELLSTLLNEQISHRTDYFTGQAAREEGGQNARMQKAKLEDFSQGIIKVLCATTVAEEGIDISACNLIIHYNYVTNEIARVQRRGRGRAKDARSILLTCEKSIKEKEEQNELRERLMNHALDELARWPRGVFQQKVSYLVQKLNAKRMEKEALEKETAAERRQIDGVYRIICSKCNHFLGLSTSIALVGTTYVIADKEFWVRTKGLSGPLPPEKADSRECKGSMPHIGEHRCFCNEKLGRIVQYQGGVLLPNLNLEKIIFIRSQWGGIEMPEGSGERYMERKWAKVVKNLFQVEKITTLQLVEMKEAPKRPESLMRKELLE